MKIIGLNILLALFCLALRDQWNRHAVGTGRETALFTSVGQ